MKRGNRKKLIGFLTRMRRERLLCIKKGHYARARQIKLWLKANAQLAGLNDAA